MGCPLAEVAMRSCISNPHVAVNISGISTPEQVRLNAASREPLPAEVVEALRQIVQSTL